MEPQLSVIEKFVVAVIGGLINLVNLFPTLPLDGLDSVTSSMDYLTHFIAQANFLVPVQDIFIIAGIVISVRLGFMLVFVVNWVIKAILDIIP